MIATTILANVEAGRLPPLVPSDNEHRRGCALLENAFEYSPTPPPRSRKQSSAVERTQLHGPDTQKDQEQALGTPRTPGLSMFALFDKERAILAQAVSEGVAAALKRKPPEVLKPTVTCRLIVAWQEIYGHVRSFQCGLCEACFCRQVGGAIAYTLHIRDDTMRSSFLVCSFCVHAGLPAAIGTVTQRVAEKVKAILVGEAPERDRSTVLLERSLFSLVGTLETLRASLKHPPWWPTGALLRALSQKAYRDGKAQRKERLAELRQRTKDPCRCGYLLYWSEENANYWDGESKSPTFSHCVEECPRCGRRLRPQVWTAA